MPSESSDRAGASGPAVQRQLVQTDDPDVARAHVSSMYAEHEVLLRGSTDQFRFRTEVVVADEVSVGHVEYSMGADLDVEGGLAFPVVMHQRAGGRLRLDSGRGSTTLGDDELMIVAPDQSYSVHWSTMDVTAVGLSARLLDEDAALLAGYEDGPVRFDLGRPVSAAAQGHWLHVQRFVARNLAGNAAASDSAVARRELIRLLNSATLTCFANSTGDAVPEPSSPATPAALRRAVSAIEENAETTLTLADLSGTARLSPRALQAAFRRHLDTTPLGYLRTVRLDRAHRQLLAARPGDGQSVATVATSWGFPQPGRFAREYRARYGTNPSETLRSGS